MYIDKIYIKNFKCFQDIVLNFDPEINLIIGGNNSGKSTIFDALRLWQIAFVKFLKDRTNNKQSSFYSQRYFSFTIEDLSFLRVSKFEKLFFNPNSNAKKFEIRLTFKGNNNVVELPIIFTRTGEGQVLRFELCKNNEKRNQASDSLSDVLDVAKGTDFKTSSLFTYINPLFKIPLYEPNFSKGFILNSLHQAKVNEIIRNLIHEHAPLKKEKVSNPNRKIKGDKLIEIERDLTLILNGYKTTNPIFEFSTQLEEEDVYISLFGKNTVTGIEVEISQLGSGTLNILNILSVLAFGDYENFKINALLLDEPDSHLHSNHQKNLFEYLKQKSKDENKQIFIITHNHELIDCFDKVLFLDPKRIKKEISINAIPNSQYYDVYKVIAPEYHLKMLEIAKKKEIEKELHNLTKPTIYCEGTSDVAIINLAYKKIYEQELFFNDQVSFLGGGGEGEVGNKLKNNNTDYKVIGILDNDYAGQSQMKKLTKDHGFNQLNDITYNNKKSYLVMLPIPKFRFDSAIYFETKTFIEYLFTDETLENKLGIELKKHKGENFKRFDEKQLDSIKLDIIKNIDKLEKNDFKYFIPIFNRIAEIIDFELPKINA